MSFTQCNMIHLFSFYNHTAGFITTTCIRCRHSAVYNDNTSLNDDICRIPTQTIQIIKTVSELNDTHRNVATMSQKIATFSKYFDHFSL